MPVAVGDHQPAAAVTTLAAAQSRLPTTTTQTAGRLTRARVPRNHSEAA
jgi:hypothetical protein